MGRRQPAHDKIFRGFGVLNAARRTKHVHQDFIDHANYIFELEFAGLKFAYGIVVKGVERAEIFASFSASAATIRSTSVASGITGRDDCETANDHVIGIALIQFAAKRGEIRLQRWATF